MPMLQVMKRWSSSSTSGAASDVPILSATRCA
jgi:hypothetical protein